MFILGDVPEPVWNVSIGNPPSHCPSMISAAADLIAAATARVRLRQPRSAATARLMREGVHDRIRNGTAADREVLDCSLGLGLPFRPAGDSDLAHRVCAR